MANNNGESRSRSKHCLTDNDEGRLCASCRTHKPWAEYAKSKTGYAGRAGECKPCASARSHASRLKNFYGLTRDDFSSMLTHQGDACAICGKRPKKQRLNVDHDHQSQLVRGLLCGDCNSVLGMYRDKIEIFQAFAAYLTTPPSLAALGREHYLTTSQQDTHRRARKGRRSRLRRY